MTHDMDRLGHSLTRILIVAGCLVTVINASLAAWLGLGEIFVGICELLGTGIGILWFASSALCLLVAFVVSQYLMIRTVVMAIALVDGLIRSRRSSVA